MIRLGTTSAGKPLDLPLDIATESTAIIARKGRGKSYTARIVAEALIANHVQIVVADPTDVWWGIRASKDGKGPGCNVVVFGGKHADLPLTESSGKTLADAVVDHGLSAILVTSHLSKAAARRFLADFAERLYERKHEEPYNTVLTLIVDESDLFAPQQMTPEAARCAGVLDECVRRGRVRGIGVIAITQRPAVLNKNILSQTEVLICLQVTGPQDRKALGEWTDANADAEQSRLFMDTLATFQRGEAWVWSPSADLFERIQVGQIKTYDSMRTPKVGEKQTATPRLRPVDLDALRTKLAATIEQAEANDPTKLKAEIARLKRELAAKPKAEAVDPAPLITCAVYNRDANDWSPLVHAACSSIEEAVKKLRKGPAEFSVPLHARTSPPQPRAVVAPPPPRPQRHRGHGLHEPQASNGDLGKAERAVLVALVQRLPKGSSNAQLALLSGYSPTSGGFFDTLAKLRAKGYMTGSGSENTPTQAGVAAVGEVPPIPSGRERLDYWCGELAKAPAAILRVIADAYPNAVDRDRLCAETGYSPTSGGFFDALAKLRKLELIANRGDLRATDDLMGDA